MTLGGLSGAARRVPRLGGSAAASESDPVLKAFMYYDTNGSGFLDYKELRSALRHMGVDTNVQGAAQLMVAYDDRPDGKMDIGEFRKLVDDLGVKFGGTTTTTTYLSSGTTTVRNSSRSLNTDTVGASFAHYDTNNSGFLDYQELRNALSHMGIDTSASGAAQILAAYDERPDGKMDIGEFRKLAHDMEGNTTSATTTSASGRVTYSDAVTAAFRHFDKNDSGFLDYNELRGALSHMGVDTTDSGAAQLLAAYDERPDGKLDVSEFRKLVSDLGVKFA